MKTFEASRLSGNNRVFPDKITIDEYGITYKRGGLGGKEETLPFNTIYSVGVITPLMGLSTLTLSTRARGKITANGFSKEDVLEMKEMVQQGISGLGFGNNSGGNSFEQSGFTPTSQAQANIELKKIELEEQKLMHEKEAREAMERIKKAEKYREKGQNFIAWLIELNPTYTLSIIIVLFTLCFVSFPVNLIGYIGIGVLIILIVRDVSKKQK